jgi:hypothetical protein
MRERHRERRTRMTRAHVEQVDLARDTSHRDLRLAPIDLGLHDPLTRLRHERLNTLAPLTSTTMNVFPDRAFSDIHSVLVTQAFPDPLRGMTLLARSVIGRAQTRSRSALDTVPASVQDDFSACS